MPDSRTPEAPTDVGLSIGASSRPAAPVLDAGQYEGDGPNCENTRALVTPARTPFGKCVPLPADNESPVWDRLWRHVPSDEKDDRLLEREEAGPRWRALVAYLQRHLGPLDGLRTVELGSGRGDLSVLLARHGARVTLLDASDRALDQARRRFARLDLDADFVKGDLFTAGQDRHGSYDVALSSGVIEHFAGSDRAAAVRAHYDVLRPGGVAIISVPHAHCIPYRIWKGYLEFRGWWPYGMEIPYTRRELVRAAGEVGFESVELECSGFWQSVGSQLCKTFFRWSPDWYARRSFLDRLMGLVLVMIAQKPLRSACKRSLTIAR